MKRDGWLHVYDLGLEEELKYPRHGREEGQGQCGISHAIFTPRGICYMVRHEQQSTPFMRLQLYVSTMRCRRATMVHLHSPSHPPLACVVASTFVDSPHTSPKPSVQRARIQ